MALAAQGLGEKISIGGAVGLLHYVDYRDTFDVDGWWAPTATVQDRKDVLQAIEKVLARSGQVKRREWGEVVSLEVKSEKRKVFSFQIAERSAQIEPSRPAPWTKVLLDSFPDLVASKMVALVERGLPRDFRDIFQVCSSALATPKGCWRWWDLRQELSKSDANRARARLAVETHLSRISQHRPLEQIEDPVQRSEAGKLRSWFLKEFLDALVD